MRIQRLGTGYLRHLWRCSWRIPVKRSDQRGLEVWFTFTSDSFRKDVMLILHLSRSSDRRSIWRYDGSDFNSIASRHRLRHYFSNACVSTDFWEILLRASLRARDDRASVERCQDWKSRTHHPCSIRSVNRPQSISLSILLIVFWWIWRTKVTSRCPVIISSARRATRNHSMCDQIPNWHVSVNAYQ